MASVTIRPPDGAAWKIASEPTEGGVFVVLDFDINGEPATVRLMLERGEARIFAKGVMASAGDAAERTSPHSRIAEAAAKP